MLVRLQNTARTEWDRTHRVWRSRDGQLAWLHKQGGRAPYQYRVVWLLRRHQAAGTPLPLKELHLNADQVAPIESPTAAETELLQEYQPIFAAHARRVDRERLGTALWRASYTGGRMATGDESHMIEDLREELAQEAGTGADSQAVRRYFADNAALLALIAARVRLRLANGAVLSFSDPLGQRLSQNRALDEAVVEGSDEDEAVAELFDASPWFHGREDIDYLRSLDDADWSVEGHHDGRDVRAPYEELYDRNPSPRFADREANFQRVLHNVAWLACPNRSVLARSDRVVLPWLAASAGHVLHAVEVAGWDYRPALVAACYDLLVLGSGLERSRQWEDVSDGSADLQRLLVRQPVQSLRFGPLGVRLLALLLAASRMRNAAGELLVRTEPTNWSAFPLVFRWIASRASSNPIGQTHLVAPGLAPDTALTALESAMQAVAPQAEALVDPQILERVQQVWNGNEGEGKGRVP